MPTFLYRVVFSTVIAFLSRKINSGQFFRDAFCHVALCPEFECHVSIDHQCAVHFEIDAISIAAASPAHLKYLARLGDWPLTSGWAAAFICCPILCNRPFDRAVRAPMLTGFTEAFRRAFHTRNWCHKFSDCRSQAPCILYTPCPEEKSTVF